MWKGLFDDRGSRFTKGTLGSSGDNGNHYSIETMSSLSQVCAPLASRPPARLSQESRGLGHG